MEFIQWNYRLLNVFTFRIIDSIYYLFYMFIMMFIINFVGKFAKL